VFSGTVGGISDLYLLDVESNEVRQLTHDKELLAFPIWTPDGRTLVCERKRAGDTQVVTVPVDGGEPTLLVDAPGQSWPYSVSGDGDRIAYAGFRDGVWNLWWVSRSTRETVQVTQFRDRDGYVRYPAWSPQGDELVFERSRTIGDLWLLPQSP